MRGWGGCEQVGWGRGGGGLPGGLQTVAFASIAFDDLEEVGIFADLFGVGVVGFVGRIGGQGVCGGVGGSIEHSLDDESEGMLESVFGDGEEGVSALVVLDHVHEGFSDPSLGFEGDADDQWSGYADVAEFFAGVAEQIGPDGGISLAHGDFEVSDEELGAMVGLEAELVDAFGTAGVVDEPLFDLGDEFGEPWLEEAVDGVGDIVGGDHVGSHWVGHALLGRVRLECRVALGFGGASMMPRCLYLGMSKTLWVIGSGQCHWLPLRLQYWNGRRCWRFVPVGARLRADIKTIAGFDSDCLSVTLKKLAVEWLAEGGVGGDVVWGRFAAATQGVGVHKMEGLTGDRMDRACRWRAGRLL